MELLALIPFYLLPAGIALAMVVWIAPRVPLSGLPGSVCLAAGIGLATAPVLVFDGYGPGVVPIWLYVVVPILSGPGIVAVLVSWLIVAAIVLVAVWLLERRKWN